jgi:RecA/RadA recombinase
MHVSIERVNKAEIIVDETLLMALASQGKITNIWGKSGAGKTIMAVLLAIAEIEAGGKVIYLTDEPRDVAVKLAMIFKNDQASATLFPSSIDGLMLARIKHFANQTDMIEQLSFAFLPSREFVESAEFKEFVDNAENYLNERVVKSFEAYKQPTMVVIDEFTRLYKRQSIGGDPGDLNQQLALQLGFLKTVARDKSMKIVVTSSSKTILTTTSDRENERFIEVPIINNLVNYYVDIDAQITWTGCAGERAIAITGSEGKQNRFYVDLAELHVNQSEV